MLDIFAEAATQGEMVVNATAGAVMLDVLSAPNITAERSASR
jgi:hypothetical protein